ncbi:MAG: FxsA family protein, partial [Pseudomonadota bacterium]|nr:FxsA family protein [Pseudomonadota bacterium]
YVLIRVGSVIGAGFTIFFVVFTAVLGAFLVRLEGLTTLRRAQFMLQRGEIPAVELVEGLVLLVSGALLLTPGFLTDTIGFLCLVPPLRRIVIRKVLYDRLVVRVSKAPHAGAGPWSASDTGAGDASGRGGPRTIEGDYERLDK